MGESNLDTLIGYETIVFGIQRPHMSLNFLMVLLTKFSSQWRHIFNISCATLFYTSKANCYLWAAKTFWHVRPTKTQISLHIRAVWSVFIVRTKKNASLVIRNSPVKIQIRLRDAQADLNLRWAHLSIGTFFDVAAPIVKLDTLGRFSAILQGK